MEAGEFPNELHVQAVNETMSLTCFAAVGGGGLLALAKSLPTKCKDVIKRGVGRIPT